MELTPELFEKTEFTERRKGYDIEQVETFLEQTGTALAQLLARTRHTAERAAHAESRLEKADAAIAEAAQRAEAAEQRAEAADRAAREATQGAAAAAASAARQNEEVEIEQAAKTLLMAKRTAEATVNEARGQAQALLEDSQNRAQRQLNEANAEAVELIRRANEQAEAEFAERRAAVLDDVQGLETRRAQLADVMTQLESRLAGYREELGRTAEELVGLAEDPTRLGARPNMSMAPDEVITSDPAHTDPGGVDPGGVGDTNVDTMASVPLGGATDQAGAVVDGGGAASQPTPGAASPGQSASSDAPGAPSGSAEQPPLGDPAGGSGASREVGTNLSGERSGGAPEARAVSGGTATAVVAEAPPAADDDAHYVDLTSQAAVAVDTGTDDRWGPGSWSDVVAEAEAIEDVGPADDRVDRLDRPTEAVQTAGPPRDRFMEELDSAVNEAVSVDDEEDAMTAFFEGSGDNRTRRFGWRR